MKRKCAKIAYDMIKDHMTVGLGGGSTVALLIEKQEKNPKQIMAVTPSADTMELCLSHHIPLLPLEAVEQVDIAFDGCDEADEKLHALKSCGGIHTKEKIIAAMAKDYVLLADETKFHETLPFRYPVTVEVIRSARAFVKKTLMEMGAEVVERKTDKKAGLVISDDGHYLMEASFSEVKNIETLNAALNEVPGIVEHGLFCGVVTKVIVAGRDKCKIVDRRNEK